MIKVSDAYLKTKKSDIDAYIMSIINDLDKAINISVENGEFKFSTIIKLPTSISDKDEAFKVNEIICDSVLKILKNNGYKIIDCGIDTLPLHFYKPVTDFRLSISWEME